MGGSTHISWLAGQLWGKRESMIEIKDRHTGKPLVRLHRDTLMAVDLQGADLRNADLDGQLLASANLINANLTGASLVKASLGEANLRGALLEEARLYGIYLFAAVLTQAILAGADLEDACLIKADLSGAVMRDALLLSAQLADARLVDADLTGANLSQANLAGANLEGAKLTDTILKRTRFDGHTRWPANFEPEKYGAIRLEQAMPQTVYPEYEIRLVATSFEAAATDLPIEAGRSKLGGLPGWIQNNETPRCPGCAGAMDFVGQIDSIGCVNKSLRALGAYVFSDCGMIYVFFCGNCNDAKAVLQFH